MIIEVLGPGCAKCEETAQLVHTALDQKGLTAEVIKISDFQEIAQKGVFATPAVIVDGEIKCSGRAPGLEEILTWLVS